ncbi:MULTISPECIES: hypothetical protein [unclassified Roseobacter]|jgi:hypothetical protein|uniref:hypothetical protein n=1 Tax=unclassified Roseobacter TaxID=196798 RepID=UPI0030EC7D59
MTLSRKHRVIALFVMIGALLAFDLSHSAPLDPFRAPAILALGSGQAASGAHCATAPRS